MLTKPNPLVPARQPGHPAAYAYCMPHQGWTPLEVYFSPFSSKAEAGHIVRYEWDYLREDIDARREIEADAVIFGKWVFKAESLHNLISPYVKKASGEFTGPGIFGPGLYGISTGLPGKPFSSSSAAKEKQPDETLGMRALPQ